MSNTPPIESQPESAAAPKRPAKIHYHIATPHGLIERKSDRPYTHAVYVIGNTDYVRDAAGNAVIENGKRLTREVPVYVADVSFCNGLHLAQRRAQQWAPRQAFIVPATIKERK